MLSFILQLHSENDRYPSACTTRISNSKGRGFHQQTNGGKIFNLSIRRCCASDRIDLLSKDLAGNELPISVPNFKGFRNNIEVKSFYLLHDHLVLGAEPVNICVLLISRYRLSNPLLVLTIIYLSSKNYTRSY